MVGRKKQIFFSVSSLATIVFVGVSFVISSLESYASTSQNIAGARGPTNKIGDEKVLASSIINELNELIGEYTNLDVAVSVVDLNAGVQYDAGEAGVIFKAASTAKLVTAVTYLHEVEIGQATLEQKISGTSARQLIQQMLEVSDNEAWAALNNSLGSKEQSFARSIGLSSFTGGEYNTITASDEAKLLTLLYQGKLIDSEHTSLLYGYMNAADGENLIKASLPNDSKIYHKYGLLWGNLHDVAIIDYQGYNLALVIYTKNPNNTLNDYDERVSLIQRITRTIFASILAGHN